jgi:phage terminase large subunit
MLFILAGRFCRCYCSIIKHIFERAFIKCLVVAEKRNLLETGQELKNPKLTSLTIVKNQRVLVLLKILHLIRNAILLKLIVQFHVGGFNVSVIIGENFQGLFSPRRHKAYYGGRGSGKSHTFATALAIITNQKRKRVACARQYQNSIQDSVKELIESKLVDLGYIGKSTSTDRYLVTKNEIVHLLNGSRFTFMGLQLNPSSIKSLEGVDIVWCEEAQAINKKSMTILIPTIRKPSSEMWWSWNPEDKDDPVDKYFRGGTPPSNSIIQEVSYLDNPYFYKTTMVEEMEHSRLHTPDLFKHTWLGDYYITSESSMFNNWQVKSIEVPSHLVPLYGADWGFNDPTVLIKFYMIDPYTIYIDKEFYRREVKLDDLPAVFDTIEGSRSNVIVADSSRPEIIEFMIRKGFRMKASTKGAGSVKDGIYWLQSKKVIIDPSCVNTISEFKKASWKVDKKTQQVTNEPDDFNNHAIDAIRYGSEQFRKQLRVKS